MKKIIICLMLGVCLMVGCGKKEVIEKPVITGGWQVYLDNEVGNISDDDQEMFDLAVKDEKDYQYTTIALLGTQVVAGTNYMFLTKATNLDSGDVSWKIVTIYRDLTGVGKVFNIKDFNIVDYLESNAEGYPEGLAGGWNINSEVKSTLNTEIEEKFNKALEGLDGAGYSPISVLGTQVVAGTNYAILTHGVTTTNPPMHTLNIVKLYVNLNGESEIINISSIKISDLA